MTTNMIPLFKKKNVGKLSSLVKFNIEKFIQ